MSGSREGSILEQQVTLTRWGVSEFGWLVGIYGVGEYDVS